MPKVGEIDFKTGEEVAAETGQTAETTETTETKVEAQAETKEETEVEETKVEETKVEEDINSLPQWAQDKLKKTESDKENYKAAALKYKGKTLKTEETKEETVEEETPEWDENSKKFQAQTLTQAENRAEAKAKAVVEDVNEKNAIQQFLEKNPKLSDDNVWKEIVANYNPTNGKGTVNDVLRDLDRALVLAKFENPNIIDLVEDKTKEVANQNTVSKTTSKVVKESNGVSPEALRLAEKMRVDPKALAEEDDSLTAEIKF